MAKTISVYSIHPKIKNLSSFFDYYNLRKLSDEYEFEWDPITPDYLLVSDSVIYQESVFKKFRQLYERAKIKICFAGEAFTPDFNVFDYCIGWDLDLKYNDRYCILPPAHEYVARAFAAYQKNDITTKKEAFRILEGKNKFCNFIYSNYLAHPMRDRLFYEVSAYKEVESLGRHLRNVKIELPLYNQDRQSSIEFKKRYKFSIASENARFPGYTSEKIYTSLYAHTVPIYWGDPQVSQYINPKAFINVHDYSSFDSLRDRIKEIDENDDLWCDIVSQPWHTDQQLELIRLRSNDYLNFFRNIFNQDVKEATRVPSGTFPDRYKYRFFYGYRSKCKIYTDLLLHKLRVYLSKHFIGR